MIYLVQINNFWRTALSEKCLWHEIIRNSEGVLQDERSLWRHLFLKYILCRRNRELLESLSQLVSIWLFLRYGVDEEDFNKRADATSELETQSAKTEVTKTEVTQEAASPYMKQLTMLLCLGAFVSTGPTSDKTPVSPDSTRTATPVLSKYCDSSRARPLLASRLVEIVV